MVFPSYNLKTSRSVKHVSNGNKLGPCSSKKKQVRTIKPLNLLHIDRRGPAKVYSRGEKKHILVIVDEFSRYTWVMFLSSKDETFKVLVVFAKQIQVNLNNIIAGTRSDHGKNFKNAKS